MLAPSRGVDEADGDVAGTGVMEGVQERLAGDLVEPRRDGVAQAGDLVDRDLTGGLAVAGPVGQRAQRRRQPQAVDRRRAQLPDHPAGIVDALPQHGDRLVELAGLSPATVSRTSSSR